MRPYELSLGGRRVGGFLSMKVQGLLRPLRKSGVLHSTFHYTPHPRCDVATVHDVFPETRTDELGVGAVETAAMARTTRTLLARKVRLVAVSQATKEQFLARYPEAKPEHVEVISPGISERFRPPARPRPHPAFRSDRINVLCVADLNPRKRFDWLLEAALAVPDPRLHIVHAGPDTVRRPAWAAQRQRERPLEARLGARLTRLGRLEDAKLLAAYQSADLLVLPTLDEGFGFPPLEALACGTPVAVNDLPVFRETLGTEGARFSGPADLEPILEAAAHRPAPTESERATRHAWVKQRHGWPAAARRLMSLYHAPMLDG
jgi:glycosyltransferase involved in cell wall biosynthesis